MLTYKSVSVPSKVPEAPATFDGWAYDGLIDDLVVKLKELTGRNWRRVDHYDVIVGVEVERETYYYQHRVRLRPLDADLNGYAQYVAHEAAVSIGKLIMAKQID